MVKSQYNVQIHILSSQYTFVSVVEEKGWKKLGYQLNTTTKTKNKETLLFSLE